MGTKHGEPERFIESVLKSNQEDCVPWPFSRHGNGRARLKRKVRGFLLKKEFLVARIICERVHGRPPTPKLVAAHSCGNGHGGCVNPKHIRWATQKQNIEDSIVHGTIARGERNGWSRLTRDDVLTIRASEGRVPRRKLAEQFSINPWYVRNIQKRRTWKWL